MYSNSAYLTIGNREVGRVPVYTGPEAAVCSSRLTCQKPQMAQRVNTNQVRGTRHGPRGAANMHSGTWFIGSSHARSDHAYIAVKAVCCILRHGHKPRLGSGRDGQDREAIECSRCQHHAHLLPLNGPYVA